MGKLELVQQTPKSVVSTGVPPWLMAFLLLSVGAFVGAYFVLRSPSLVHHLEWHVELATAIGPITAILTLFTVVAALWSIELQRRAVATQQGEIDRHMKLLEEQREQFARSAKAQEALAKAQGASARAQRRANRESAALRLAQHSNTIAVLMSAHVQLATHLTLGTSDPETDFRKALLKGLQSHVETMKQRLAEEQLWEAQLRRQIMRGEAQ